MDWHGICCKKPYENARKTIEEGACIGRYLVYNRRITPGDAKMTNDFDTINAMLNAMADEGILERMVEPCDDIGIHPLEYADIAGIMNEVFDEMYPYANYRG